MLLSDIDELLGALCHIPGETVYLWAVFLRHEYRLCMLRGEGQALKEYPWVSA